ncbi:MAG: UDP-N-acetylmuramyl-tripeptide synthetase [bacterium]|nr:UDP-N-acetylmuramyl-tripeptide synthetase [bacterium]
MIHALKKMVPESVKRIYHLVLSWLAVLWYRNPSKDLIVVGVTGTNGKTTTSLMISHALEGGGVKTGAITTARIKVGRESWTNMTKMTMPGRFALQKLLRRMVREGCRYAVVEVSSQGVVQHRHRGVCFDVAVFTNLTPEHIEAHGGFEAYKNAKLDFFRHVARSKRKSINGNVVPKIAVLNAGDEHAKDFELPGFDRVVWFGEGSKNESQKIVDSLSGVSFQIHGSSVTLQMPGVPNAWNASTAIATAESLGISLKKSVAHLEKMISLPGRFQLIDQGQDWNVMIDYAAEPVALEILYRTILKYPHKRIIHVLGSCGGGRDVARRPILGKIAGENADVVIVTNEDPYDDDPRAIMDQVATGAKKAGKKVENDLFLIEDRKEAIQKAMDLASAKDFVLLTGKGNEPWICVAGGKKEAWDEAEIAKQAILKSMLQ